MKTIKFYTLGCKANQYDTQSIREQFVRAGFKELEDGNPADICCVNTCTVTHKADSESLQLIRKVIKENSRAKIIVTGCLTELDSDRITHISRAIKIIKNSGKNRIAQFLNKRTKKGISYFKNHTRAFLKIQDGCNNFCSYCKVPLVRGPSRSKPLKEIIQEAEGLAQNGYKEIVLTGICLGSYDNLVSVIERLEKIEGLLRIRLSSIEAGDISDKLISKMAVSKKICRHLHIPIQSGDDIILKQMNRHYTSADYLSLIKKLRRKIPQVAITTDILVGFPGENEENFRNTVRLVRKVMPLRTHIFPYSKREGTPAADLLKAPSPDVIKDRIELLKEACEATSLKYKEQFLGRIMPVLIEDRVKDSPEFWEGYSDNYIKVRIKSALNLKNKLAFLRLRNIVDDGIEAYFR